MKIVLYSDEKKVVNEDLDNMAISLTGKKKPSMTYIPSTSDKKGKYFDATKIHFEKYGLSDFLYFDIDEDYNENARKEAFKSDIVYLSGGNTIKFLKNIRRRKVDKDLNMFLKAGGVVIGVSAGAMLLTKSIACTVNYHSEIGNLKETTGYDYGDLNKEDLIGLGLLDFEFIPHFKNSNKDVLLKGYIDSSSNTIFGCSDGAGLVIKDEEIEICGNCFIYNI